MKPERWHDPVERLFGFDVIAPANAAERGVEENAIGRLQPLGSIGGVRFQSFVGAPARGAARRIARRKLRRARAT